MPEGLPQDRVGLKEVPVVITFPGIDARHTHMIYALMTFAPKVGGKLVGVLGDVAMATALLGEGIRYQLQDHQLVRSANLLGNLAEGYHHIMAHVETASKVPVQILQVVQVTQFEQFPLVRESGESELGVVDVRLGYPELPGVAQVSQLVEVKHPRLQLLIEGEGNQVA